MQHHRPILTLPELPPGFICWNNANANIDIRLAEIADRARDLQALVDSEGRAFTSEEATEIDGLAAEFSLLEARLVAHNKAEESISRMSRGVGRQTTAEGPGTDFSLDAGVHRSGPPANGFDGAALRALQRQPFAGRHYFEMFGRPQEKNPFPSVDEFLDIIVNNRFDPRLIRNAGMSEAEESGGGFFVPTQFEARFLDSALEQAVLWPRVRTEAMVSRTKEIASFANSDNSASAPFGLPLQWLAEKGVYNEQKSKTRKIILTASKAGVYVPYSIELSEDGGESFATQLVTALTGSLAWGVDDAILNGSGVGRPLGILNSPALISVAKEGGQIADTIVWENITKMFSRLLPQCVPNAIWLTNSSCLPQLLTMTIPTGSNAAFYPVLSEQSGAYSMLGRPLFLTEKCAAIGDKGDLVLVDPSKYALGIRRGITIKLDSSVKFASDEIVVKVSIRLAGEGELDAAFTPKNGSTLSSMVTLDAR